MDRIPHDDAPPSEPEPTDRISYLLPDGCKDITDAWRREEQTEREHLLMRAVGVSFLAGSPLPSTPASSAHPKSARPVRIPVHMLDTFSNLLRAQKQLARKLGRDPTHEEIVQETHLTVERVRAVLRMVQRHPVVSLPVTISLRELAEILGLKIYELIRELIGMKLFVKSASVLDFATAAAICSKLGVIALPKDGK